MQEMWEMRVWSLGWEDPLEKEWQPTPVFVPGKSHGQRNLVGCSPWGFKESDVTERLHCHFSLSCIGEGNGNPLQCLCLENPRDGGAWWAAVCGVAQSRTRLERLSSSSSFPLYTLHCPSHLLHLANSSTSFYDLFRSGHLLCKASLDIALLQYRRGDYNIPCLYLSLLWQPYSPNLNTLRIFVNDLTTFSFNRDKFLRKSQLAKPYFIILLIVSMWDKIPYIFHRKERSQKGILCYNI